MFWDAVGEAARWLEAKGVRYVIDGEILAAGIRDGSIDASRWESRESEAINEEADVILSFGGDGTFLTTAWKFGKSGTPILGVNLGRLGFLADVDLAELQPALQAIVDKNYGIVARKALDITHLSGETPGEHWALNEVVITRSGSAGLITIAVKVNGTHLNNYWADGLIIATPTGSTAYSLSAGGPIVEPTTNALILTPLASHSLTMRPIVLPGNVSIDVHVADSDLPYVFAADGRSVIVDEPGSSLRIKTASQSVNMVQLPDGEFFDTLREKLMWGFRKRRQS